MIADNLKEIYLGGNNIKRKIICLNIEIIIK